MRTRRTPLFLINALPGLLLAGCVSGTPRVGTIGSSPSTTSTEDDAGDPTSAPNSPGAVDADFPATPAYDGGVAPPQPYDADDEPSTTAPPPDTAPAWWPASFVPGSLPDPSNGRGSHAGSSACGSCHQPGGTASSSVWLMGGVVYADASSATPVASAEIGIKTGTQFFHAYSASNGYFWLPASTGAIDWTTAEIRIRTAKGELPMLTPADSGDCQRCHTAGNRIYPKP